ncbi:MAG TPA: hypothetical protein VHC22_05190 [Pirellulales bacterium]|nr:hypothetical protein [Pirellulales bacterium]
MSRLATVVGALSAIVSLIDFLVARSFLSHWVQRQIKHGDDGWQISPTLNFVFIVGLVGLVWLLTDTAVNDAEARKRLHRVRTHVVLVALVVWFFFGPSIGETDTDRAPRTAQSDSGPEGNHHAAAIVPPQSGQLTGATGVPGRQPLSAGPTASQGHTSQFTWNQSARQPPRGGSWRPGDGLRAMARFLEDSSEPARVPGR